MPRPSRRTVLATGSAVGGALMAGGLPAQASAVSREAAEVTTPGDPWRTVLDDADLVWQKLPKTWYEGPYLGNGFLGSGIYAEPSTQPGGGTTALRFNVQHSEVQDHRPEFGSLFGLARLPIGHFTLEPVGRITGIDWRLRLRDAELTGTLTTDKGTLKLRAQIHTTRSVLAVEVTPSAGERGFRWVFHPAEAISPRAAFKPLPEGYAGNPPAEVKEPDGYAPRSIRHSKLRTLSRVNYVVARAGPALVSAAGRVVVGQGSPCQTPRRDPGETPRPSGAGELQWIQLYNQQLAAAVRSGALQGRRADACRAP